VQITFGAILKQPRFPKDEYVGWLPEDRFVEWGNYKVRWGSYSKLMGCDYVVNSQFTNFKTSPDLQMIHSPIQDSPIPDLQLILNSKLTNAQPSSPIPNSTISTSSIPEI